MSREHDCLVWWWCLLLLMARRVVKGNWLGLLAALLELRDEGSCLLVFGCVRVKVPAAERLEMLLCVLSLLTM